MTAIESPRLPVTSLLLLPRCHHYLVLTIFLIWAGGSIFETTSAQCLGLGLCLPKACCGCCCPPPCCQPSCSCCQPPSCCSSCSTSTTCTTCTTCTTSTSCCRPSPPPCCCQPSCGGCQSGCGGCQSGCGGCQSGCGSCQSGCGGCCTTPSPCCGCACSQPCSSPPCPIQTSCGGGGGCGGGPPLLPAGGLGPPLFPGGTGMLPPVYSIQPNSIFVSPLPQLPGGDKPTVNSGQTLARLRGTTSPTDEGEAEESAETETERPTTTKKPKPKGKKKTVVVARDRSSREKDSAAIDSIDSEPIVLPPVAADEVGDGDGEAKSHGGKKGAESAAERSDEARVEKVEKDKKTTFKTQNILKGKGDEGEGLKATIEELYDDLSPTAASSFFVADASSNLKKLLPVDIFQKRHHLLKQQRRNVKNKLKHFSAPSISDHPSNTGAGDQQRTRAGGGRNGEPPLCNNFKLGKVMVKAMVNDVSLSKRLVRKATELSFHGKKFDVLCALGDFSYSIYAQHYCEATRGNITCFAFA